MVVAAAEAAAEAAAGAAAVNEFRASAEVLVVVAGVHARVAALSGSSSRCSRGPVLFRGGHFWEVWTKPGGRNKEGKTKKVFGGVEDEAFLVRFFFIPFFYKLSLSLFHNSSHTLPLRPSPPTRTPMACPSTLTGAAEAAQASRSLEKAAA